jgi:hypothetical protein
MLYCLAQTGSFLQQLCWLLGLQLGLHVQGMLQRLWLCQAGSACRRRILYLLLAQQLLLLLLLL